MVYTENDLIFPTLEALDQAFPHGLSTTQLISILTDKLRPTGQDVQILRGRKDTYFSQKVRNLKSHDTLIKRGLATYSNGNWVITPKGKEYLFENEDLYESLKNQNFKEQDIGKQIINDFKDLVVEEGSVLLKSVKLRKRSQELRSEKIKELKRQSGGRIFCIVCDFDFSKKYGEHGEGYIEIHHLEPVSMGQTNQSMVDALRKVVPLCSNCHRMIHRNKDKLLTPMDLRKIIELSTKE